MLIDKGLTAGEVVTIKLINGEEIIARFVSEDDKTYSLEKLLALSMGPKGIGLVPYTFTVNLDKTLKLNKSTVVFIANTDKEFADQYIQSTTGIALS